MLSSRSTQLARQRKVAATLFRVLIEFASIPQAPSGEAGAKFFAALPTLHWTWWVDLHYALLPLRTTSSPWKFDLGILLAASKQRKDGSVVSVWTSHQSPFWGRFRIPPDTAKCQGHRDIRPWLGDIGPWLRDKKRRRRLTKAEQSERDYLLTEYADKKSELRKLARELGVSGSGKFASVCISAAIELTWIAEGQP